MKLKWTLALLSVVVLGSTLIAQQPAQTPTPQDKVNLPKGQMPTLGRPTKGDDALPTFNFEEYYVGKWTFEWDVPAGELGDAGKITGTTIYKPGTDGKFYEADTEANGPDGAFKVHETIAYLAANKTITKHVTDSRGFSYISTGPIGGDLGGYYNIYFETSPFKYKGKTIRFKQAVRMLSPVNYKVQTTVSIDGGPYTNYGNPWWRKEVPGVTTR